MNPFIVEACVDSIESAMIATKAGANRLELCSNLIIGGTTPTMALYQQVRKYCNNKVNVLIRPRFGDFCYSNLEFELIREEIKQFKENGADGVVVGILKPDGTIDYERMQVLVKDAGNMTVTFHRAFDMCVNPMEALLQLKQLGVDSVLTSGQKDTSLQGKECINNLVQESKGNIEILVGAGVTSKTIEQLYKATGATAYHMSGKKLINSLMDYRKEGVHMGLDSFSEYQIWQTDSEEISKALEIVRKLQMNKESC